MKKMRNRWLAVALAAAMAMGTFSLPVCAEEAESSMPVESEIFESVLASEGDFETVLQESESAETELQQSETIGEEAEFIEESESIAETESRKETETEKIVETDKETEIETAEETEEELEANYGNTAKGFVYRLYKLVLGREPDKQGLNEWTNYLTSGQKTGAEVADGFIYSKELTARKLSDSAYVEMLYKTFLNRSSDSSGKKYWVTRLQKGMSRAYVYRGFANSTEFQGICGQYGIRSGEVVLTVPKDQNEGVTMFVYRCYQKFLGRKPDDGGLNDWCNRLLSGSENAKQVAYGFVMSKEFQEAGLSNTSYVKTMYLGLFDRTADSTGLKNWTSKLNNGNSRESVFYGFADSQEFRKLAESFGLDSTWAGTAVEYKIGKADFIQILLDNENVWKLGRDKINTSNRTTPGYSLVDLNLDGTLELIVSAASGADEDTPVKVYRIQNECLIEVGTCIDRGQDVLINNLSLNQDKRTGEYVYMANYKGPTCLSYIDVRYSANGVEKYSRWWNGYENGNTQGKFIYKVGGKPVSEAYANNVLNSIVGHWRNANLKKGYVANKDWVKYSKAEKKKALESLYDAFSYEQ